jgi:phosphoglycerol transferase
MSERPTLPEKAGHLAKAAQPHLFILTVSTLLLVFFLKLWTIDPSIPYGYQGDAIWSAATAKTTQDTGWFLTNPQLGFPFGYQIFDFPLADSLLIFLIKAASICHNDWGLAINLVFWISFPAIAWIAFATMRSLGISLFSSIAFSLLFAFAPFHFARAAGHLFLGLYFAVPLGVLAALAPDTLRRRWYLGLPIGFLISGCGVYYAFFSCFLIAGSLLLDLVEGRPLKEFRFSVYTILAVITGCFAQVFPTLLFWLEKGPLTSALRRSPSDADTYGLRIAQLLIPPGGHRLTLLDKLNTYYNTHNLHINENAVSSLGLAASLGFVLLIFIVVFVRNTNTALARVARLNLSLLLLATMGGFGSLLANLGFSQIRSYNRASIFIALFGLIGLALVVDRMANKLREHHKSLCKPAFLPLVAAILFALFEQISPSFAAIYHGDNEARFKRDQKFYQHVQTVLPSGTAVYQVPYRPFPESGYDAFKPYLHTQGLKWSYGTYVGRREDNWQRTVAGLPETERANLLYQAGFAALLLDTRVLPSATHATVLAELHAAYGRPLLESGDGEYLFAIRGSSQAPTLFKVDEQLSRISEMQHSACPESLRGGSEALNERTGTGKGVVDSGQIMKRRLTQLIHFDGWGLQDTEKEQAPLTGIALLEGSKVIAISCATRLFRGDVATALGVPQAVFSGWTLDLPARTLGAGTYHLRIIGLTEDKKAITLSGPAEHTVIISE